MTLQWKRYREIENFDDESNAELTVLRQHWRQIQLIVQKSLIDHDDVTCVLSHFQHAVTLLTNEVATQERPGPVLLFFISESILETFFVWSLSCPEYAAELKYHQLRCFEFLLSRSQHELLFHKQIFKPLLNLLRSCESSVSLDLIEKHMIVVLNQVCVSITKSPELLEFCFDISSDHGPSRFVIFSLLIPFVHRDGLSDRPCVQGITTGQQARDALLLIMQLSNRNEPIAKYIGENTNFCPILATGLSALYSDLPRRLATTGDDWFTLTKQDWCDNVPLMQFMNSLQFCNDVIQIAHPVISQYLLQYIYHGFLIPVLGPSIYQDLHEVPVKFSELQQLANTMDEVIAATAYLDLFLRTVDEPALLKVFLKFVLCARIDEIGLLDTLIQRINVSTKLGLVSLGLFHTLINLNCEDIMYRLVFMYLIPCRHMMWSQRRYITDMEIYGKNAERFLSLKPMFASKEKRSNSMPSDQTHVNAEQQTGESGARIESAFCTYLKDAHFSILRCRVACRCWSAPYDGETPSPDAILDEADKTSLTTSISTLNTDNDQSQQTNLSLSKHDQQLGSHVAASHDSGIHEEGLEGNAPLDHPSKPTEQPFQLPFWLANNQPVPDELLAKRELTQTSYYDQCRDDDDDDDDDDDFGQPSSFYAFSFIDLPGDQEDTWSLQSFATSNNRIRNEIKTCVATLHSCLNQFREMNEQPDDTEAIVSSLLNELLDRVEQADVAEPAESKEDAADVPLDYNLLAELFNKKLTLNEFLALLDQLIATQSPRNSKQTGDELLADLLRLSELIEQQRSSMDGFDPTGHAFKACLHHPLETQSSDTATPVLGTSISMDLSVFAGSDLSNPNQSAMFASSTPLQSSLLGGKPADIGPFLRTIFSKLENMLHNPLHVNLLLTGIISRLAHYSQPLLRSLLLNHSLVLETNVKSLFQILINLKAKLETISLTYNNFENLVQLAYDLLYQREYPGEEPEEVSRRPRSPSRTRSKSAGPNRERVSTGARLLNFLRGRSRAAERNNELEHPQVTLVDKTSMKFINVRNQPSPAVANEWDDPKTRSIAYCAVVFTEFLKELAAITLEHSVQQFDDDQLFENITSASSLL